MAKGKAFYQLKTRVLGRQLAQTLAGGFERQETVRSGVVVVGNRQVLVAGQRYPLENGEGLAPGEAINVVNVSRPAAAIYAPADRPGVGGIVSTGGGTSASGDYVRRSGDSMTGPLTLPAAPTAPMHAATKQYVDQRTLDDASDVTIDAPADNEVLAYDASSGEWINQTAEEANLQEKLTTGDLTASSPLQADATRQVIGGALTLSLDQSGIDHGSIGGLGDDDHTQYLLASGARAGSASQAQNFGATGIKTDVVAEATTDAGVTVDGVLLKDAGATFGADVNFAGYKAVAMTCDRGTSFPSSPQTGQWFYRADCKCLFFYEGTWKPIVSFGDMTLYVDGTNGSDAPGQGFAPGSGATATIQYAINLIPPIVGGNVTVNIAAGTYAGFTLPKKTFLGDYKILIYGEKTTLESGTMTAYKNDFKVAGTGTVNTPSGGSTTVTLGGGGSTSVFWVGAWITANNQTRRVVSITDSTTFVVDSAVDWYNGGSGFSWTYTQFAFRDSSKSWSDDQFNNKLVRLKTDFSLPYWYAGTIEDTIASSAQITLYAGIMHNANNPYEIISLRVTINSATTIYASNTEIYTIIFASYVYVMRFTESVVIYSCYFRGASVSVTAYEYANLSVYGSWFDNNGSTTYSAFSVQRYCEVSIGGVYATPYYYFVYAYEGPTRVRISSSRCDHCGSTIEPIRARGARLDFSGSRDILVKRGTRDVGITASWHSILESVTTGLLSVGFGTPYSVDSATYSFAT